jgi:hypothetical protein
VLEIISGVPGAGVSVTMQKRLYSSLDYDYGELPGVILNIDISMLYVCVCVCVCVFWVVLHVC